MSRQVGVRRSRFQPFAAPVITEPLQDCGGAHFAVSLGQPRKLIGLKAHSISALAQKGCMNRTFSAGPWGIKFVGRCPTLQLKIAPLALNRAKVEKLVRTTHYFLWSCNAPSNAPTLRLIAPSFSPSRGRDAF